MSRSYTQLARIEGHRARYEYLRVHAGVGSATFGFERWLNQAFYNSSVWRTLRHEVIARDLGCDLGVEGYEINDQIFVHHMNPVRVQDIVTHNSDIVDPEFLICVSLRTHNAIHYGDESLLVQPLVSRRPGDTKLW